MKKRLFMLVCLLVAAVALASCTETKTYEIAIVTDVGQLKDGGFNQGTYEGAEQFAKAVGKTYKYYQPANGADAQDADRVQAMRQAIENGAKVIVTPGFLQAAAIQTVAAENPEVKFVFVDGWQLGLPNVTAISYKEEESGFFAGYAAVKEGYTKLGGTFGGDGTNAACNRFAYGYVQGIEAAAAEMAINEQLEVRLSFNYGGSFQSSPELQTQISGWYQNGTQIVFSCGGSMLQSVKAAASEGEGRMIIGVDVDQHAESDRILTSAVKGLAASVVKVLNEWNEGKWETLLSDKLSNLGAVDNATGLPTAKEAWRFSKFTVEEYQALFNKVVNGELQIMNDVTADMKSADAWSALDEKCTHLTINFE